MSDSSFHLGCAFVILFIVYSMGQSRAENPVQKALLDLWPSKTTAKIVSSDQYWEGDIIVHHKYIYKVNSKEYKGKGNKEYYLPSNEAESITIPKKLNVTYVSFLPSISRIDDGSQILGWAAVKSFMSAVIYVILLLLALLLIGYALRPEIKKMLNGNIEQNGFDLRNQIVSMAIDFTIIFAINEIINLFKIIDYWFIQFLFYAIGVAIIYNVTKRLKNDSAAMSLLVIIYFLEFLSIGDKVQDINFSILIVIFCILKGIGELLGVAYGYKINYPMLVRIKKILNN